MFLFLLTSQVPQFLFISETLNIIVKDMITGLKDPQFNPHCLDNPHCLARLQLHGFQAILG